MDVTSAQAGGLTVGLKKKQKTSDDGAAASRCKWFFLTNLRWPLKTATVSISALQCRFSSFKSPIKIFFAFRISLVSPETLDLTCDVLLCNVLWVIIHSNQRGDPEQPVQGFRHTRLNLRPQKWWHSSQGGGVKVHCLHTAHIKCSLRLRTASETRQQTVIYARSGHLQLEH